MILVKVELHPASGRPAKTLVVGKIVNDGTGHARRGNYNFAFCGKSGKLLKHGRVEDYPRKSYQVWELVRRALNTAFGKGKG